MMENNLISDEKLEKVSAGGDTVGKYYFFGQVGKYDGVVGQYYYIVDSTHTNWWWGRLTKTCEKGLLGIPSRRKHEFMITKQNGNGVSAVKEFHGDRFTLYNEMRYK